MCAFFLKSHFRRKKSFGTPRTWYLLIIIDNIIITMTELKTDLKKINPTSKVISSSIGSANGSTKITRLFYNKYRSLYSSVPSDDNELREFHDVINSKLSIVPTVTLVVLLMRH